MSVSRFVAWTILAAMLAGLVPPPASAQQPSQAPVAAPPTAASAAQTPAPPPSGASAGPAPGGQPDLFEAAVKTGVQPQRESDIYDVGAGAVTVLRAPFKAGLCAVGGGVGLALFVLTLGSAYRAATRIVEEGCSGKWVLSGDDLRPAPAVTRAFDWERERD